MKVSPLISCVAVSVACHLGLYLGKGNQDSTVYKVSLEESVSSVAVDIVPIREEVPEVVKAKPKPPKPEEPLLTTEAKTEETVEKTPLIEEIPELEEVPDPIVEKIEEIEDVLSEKTPLEEPVVVDAPIVENASEQKQEQIDLAARTQEISGAFTESYPVVNRCPAPRYPIRAREKGIEGKVILRVTVNPEGRVDKIKIQQSSGHKELDGCAVRTIRKHWVFEPARKGKKAVVSTVNVELMFRLNQS